MPGSTPDVRDLADPQSPRRPFPRGVYDPEWAALGRTAPCLGRYCLKLASLNLPRRIDFYFTTVSKAGLIKCLYKKYKLAKRGDIQALFTHSQISIDV